MASAHRRTGTGARSVREKEGIMENSTIIVALVLVFLFVTGVVWMEMHSRRNGKQPLDGTETNEVGKPEQLRLNDPAMRKIRASTSGGYNG